MTTRPTLAALSLLLLAATAVAAAPAPRFTVSYTPEASEGPLDGRLIFVFSELDF